VTADQLFSAALGKLFEQAQEKGCIRIKLKRFKNEDGSITENISFLHDENDDDSESISDDELVDAIEETGTMSQALILLDRRRKEKEHE